MRAKLNFARIPVLLVVTLLGACIELEPAPPADSSDNAYASATLNYFGYWDAHSDPRPIGEELADQQDYANVTMRVKLFYNPGTGRFEDPEGGLALARAANLKVIVGYEHNLHAGTLFPTINWWGNDPQIFNAWVELLTPHVDNIAAIWVADEADCGAPFPNGWTEENCALTRANLETVIARIKTAFPTLPTWVNYTSAFAFGLGGPAYDVPANADWISFDCYTTWDHCFGNSSVADLHARLRSKLRPHQRIAMVPPALRATLTDAQVAAVADQYLQLALSDPKVVGIFPFIWWTLPGSWTGARDAPIIRAKYEEIGRAITGRGSRSIVGNIDGVTRIDGASYLVGWACAEGFEGSIAVHVYLDGGAGQGTFAGAFVANGASEPAVAQACNVSGTAYRFHIPLDPYQADHPGAPIYVHGISPYGLTNLLIAGSGVARVPGTPVDRSITGWIDSVSPSGGPSILSGWACARTSDSPISVHVYAGGPAGSGTFVTAAAADLASESAVAQACNAGGTAYRFQIPVDGFLAQFGGAPIYVHGISPFGLANQLIGNSGALRFPVLAADSSITGRIDGIAESGGQSLLSGWACARTYNGPINVHLYASGPAGAGTFLGAAVANVASEPAVAQACSASGAAYRFLVPLDPYRAVHGGASIFVHGISPFGLANLTISNSGNVTIPAASLQ